MPLKTLTTLFEYYRKRLPSDFNFEKDTHFESGRWRITIRNEGCGWLKNAFYRGI